MAKQKGVKPITENRRARHEYFVLETLEAGIQLAGTEVKSLRAGRVNLKDSHAAVRGGEMFVFGMHISPYEQGNIHNKDPLRERRLLLHKNEIRRLYGQVKQQGCTLVPLSLYFKEGRVKMALALCKGKKLYDKREDAQLADSRREMEREFKERYS